MIKKGCNWFQDKYRLFWTILIVVWYSVIDSGLQLHHSYFIYNERLNYVFMQKLHSVIHK